MAIKRMGALLLALALVMQPLAIAKPLTGYNDWRTLYENAESYGADEGLYLTALRLVSDLGIMGRDASYNDGQTLTRAEMFRILYIFCNSYEMTSVWKEYLTWQSVPFTDVTKTHWAYPYVVWSYQRGMSRGTGATTFAPDAAASYQQALQALMNALGNDPDKNPFDWHHYVARLAFAEDYFRLCRGFEPKNVNAITLGEFAVMISFALDAHPISYSGTNDTIVRSVWTHRDLYF